MTTPEKWVLLIGDSTESIDKAIENAVEKGSQGIYNIESFDVGETIGHVYDGKVSHWEVTIKAYYDRT
ncbi:MAG: dodecin family protein [Candidatus Sedimenticola sp. (ex Thyasira tokunagai)]